MNDLKRILQSAIRDRSSANTACERVIVKRAVGFVEGRVSIDDLEMIVKEWRGLSDDEL